MLSDAQAPEGVVTLLQRWPIAKTFILDTIYTADEAAARLRLTNRAVIKLGRQYGLCSRRGRDYLFLEADLLGLWEVLREPERLPKPTQIKAHISDFRFHESLQKLTKKKNGPRRKRWEATNVPNKEMREATKAAVVTWKDDEPLGHSCRDPAYWTPERKERRRR